MLTKGQWVLIERGWWRAADFGTAVRRPDGWYASRSAYRDKLIEPIAGPCKTREEACALYEKAMKKRWEESCGRR